LAQKNVIFLLDEERTYSAVAATEAIRQPKFEILAPYSPHLAPSHYLVSGPLKEALRGRIFASDEEITGAVHTGLPSQQKKLSSNIF
jgi:hypothetical protein